MSYNINFEVFKSNFAMPTAIVDDDIKSIDGFYLKVILLIFKNSDKTYSTHLLSSLLNEDEKRVAEAIEFWEKKGILSCGNINAEGVCKAEKAIPPVFELSKLARPAVSRAVNGEVSYLLEFMEDRLKRPITSTEHKTIIHILESLRLPADVVVMAIEYCVSIDKFNMRYLEKVCTTWSDSGITNHELAEKYLKILKDARNDENKIKKLFSLDRNLIDSECKFILVWVNEYQASLDMIKLAYERTINAINKLSFPYINKILQSWHEKGFKTIEDVKNDKVVSGNTKASYDIEEIDKFWDNIPKLI